MKRMFFMLTLLLAASAARAQSTWTPFGSYTQLSTYFTTVQQPINADGTSVYPAKKAGVVPVKFTLAVGKGDVTIFSTSSTSPYGGVYTLPSSLTLDQLTTLMFSGTITGSCGGGSPRFQINYGSQNIMIYLGTPPNFTDANCGSFGPNHNFAGDTDLRVDTSQISGGTFYDTLIHAQTMMAGVPIQEIDFVVDGYWLNNNTNPQQVELASMTVNNQQFVFAGAPTPTCTLPPSTIDVQQLVGNTTISVDETLVTLPADNGNNFRVVDCQYMYNLSTKQLSAGNYKVFANINGGGDVTTGGQFALK